MYFLNNLNIINNFIYMHEYHSIIIFISFNFLIFKIKENLSSCYSINIFYYHYQLSLFIRPNLLCLDIT